MRGSTAFVSRVFFYSLQASAPLVEEIQSVLGIHHLHLLEGR